MKIYVCALNEAPTSGYRQEYETDSLEEAEGIYDAFLRSALRCDDDDVPPFTCWEKGKEPDR
jgi:hypothetical protein